MLQVSCAEKNQVETLVKEFASIRAASTSLDPDEMESKLDQLTKSEFMSRQARVTQGSTSDMQSLHQTVSDSRKKIKELRDMKVLGAQLLHLCSLDNEANMGELEKVYDRSKQLQMGNDERYKGLLVDADRTLQRWQKRRVLLDKLKAGLIRMGGNLGFLDNSLKNERDETAETPPLKKADSKLKESAIALPIKEIKGLEMAMLDAESPDVGLKENPSHVALIKQVKKYLSRTIACDDGD